MTGFHYDGGSLYCDGVALAEIAGRAATPVYVYSAAAIRERYRAYAAAFGDAPHAIFYAVKANSNLSILGLLAGLGSGFDIVSAGELFRVVRAGGDPAKVVFSGVGKQAAEIEYALEHRIHSFNCESEAELDLLEALAARAGVRARVALRVNPEVNAATHPYIATGLREHKFGVPMADAERIYSRAASFKHLDFEGASCHIGSQILDTGPMLEAFEKMLALVERLRAGGAPIATLDLGGGLGIAYQRCETAPAIGDFVTQICARAKGRDLQIGVEPGRSIVGEAGALLSRVLYRKQNGSKRFVVVDAGMNDLIRPALYQSHHEILPVRQNQAGTLVADVVGPVCESGDFLARDREIASVMPGDLVAVCAAGAYGFVAASNYNSRPRAAEVLVDGDSWSIVRRRETFEDLIRGEKEPSAL